MAQHARTLRAALTVDANRCRWSCVRTSAPNSPDARAGCKARRRRPSCTEHSGTSASVRRGICRPAEARNPGKEPAAVPLHTVRIADSRLAYYPRALVAALTVNTDRTGWGGVGASSADSPYAWPTNRRNIRNNATFAEHACTDGLRPPEPCNTRESPISVSFHAICVSRSSLPDHAGRSGVPTASPHTEFLAGDFRTAVYVRSIGLKSDDRRTQSCKLII